ncbi:MAG: ATP-binding protein [Clostridium sp.]
MVINKITENIKVPFRLEHLERTDDTPVHKAIREAFVNQIIHADFNTQGVLKIIKKKDSLEFTNPGTLKIDLESIFRGGNSKSRNTRIQKMFIMIGLGEGAGSGFPKILSAWNEQHWRIPELKEDNNLNQVSLKLWSVSMIPDDCLESIKEIFSKNFKLFNKDEILILATAYLEGSVNNSRIQLMIDKHPYDITKMLHDLVEKGNLIVDGYGKGKMYYLNEDYKITTKETNSGVLTDDENRILQYIVDKGSINNEESRSNFKFGKHKNVSLFNKLIKKGYIDKVGNGSATKYIIKDK